MMKCDQCSGLITQEHIEGGNIFKTPNGEHIHEWCWNNNNNNNHMKCDNCGSDIPEDQQAGALKDKWVNNGMVLCDECSQDIGDQDIYSLPR